MGIQSLGRLQPNTTKAPSIDTEAIQTWLTNYLSQLLDIEPTTIDVSHSFESYGLDSATSIALTADLADWLGNELEPTLIYEYQTIEELAEYLFSTST